MNRSGLVRIIRDCVDIGIQTKPSNVPPDIRKIRNVQMQSRKYALRLAWLG